MSEELDLLISFIGEVNITDQIAERPDGENTLKELASQVIEDFGRDEDSMSEWSQMVDEGKRIARQETKGKSQPWDGASNFKSPAILEASITFGDRSSTELLRGRNLVKVDVIGADPEGQKRKSADRVIEYSNWQLNYQMDDWRESQGRMLYELPATGAVFKKTFFDPIEGVNKSELIHYPDFAVNQATSSIKEMKSFTHPMDFSVNQVLEKQRAEIWSDVQIYPENADGDEGSNEEEDVTDSIDNEQRFLEQYCFFDLDEDGYEEPYVVTVHEQSQQVVRIVSRYEVEGIIVKEPNGTVRRLTSIAVTDGTAGLELVRINAIETITKYGFIPDPEGTFLDIGYYHLLSALSRGINEGTNMLMDSGTLANMQGGFLAKNFRKRMGNMDAWQGRWISTDISAVDLANGIQPHKFKEPSPTLAALVQDLKTEIDQLTVNLDLKGVLAPNAPATTTLALIQEAMLPTSAIMQRILGAESKEFRKLFVLNSKFTDPQEYQRITDDPDADFQADFDLIAMDIMPTANADMSSKMQRIQQADIVVSQAQNIGLLGGDIQPIYELWFDAIGAEELKGQVFPSEEDITEEQRGRIEAQRQQQADQRKLLAIQIDHAEREVIRKEAETRAKLANTAADIRKIESEVLLNSEKAETEETKNRINVYTAQLAGLRGAVDSTLAELAEDRREREDAERLSGQAGNNAPIIPNITRTV